MSKYEAPPKYAEKLLTLFVKEELAEEILGDLEEKFFDIAERKSLLRAKWNYWYQVLNYLRPFAIKNIHVLPSIYLPMYRHNFLISYRTLLKNKGYALLNILGLTLGIACAMTIFLIMRYEMSFDTFHSNADRIYRVVIGEDLGNADPGIPHELGNILENEIPEVEKAAIAYKLNPNETQVEVEEVLMRNPDIVFTTPSFFELFEFEWIKGSPQSSLSEPGKVVITESLAQEWFRGNAMGQQIRLNNQFDLIISGILKDLPKNTDFPIQIAVSHETFAQSEGYNKELTTNRNSFYQTFLLLNEHAEAAQVESKFYDIWDKYLGKEVAEDYNTLLQPLSDVHFNAEIGNTNFSKKSITYETIWTLGLIGILILLAASINFINLSTAQAVKRSKEVGIRKVLGSNRGQLIAQFLIEAFLLCGVSTVIALIIVPNLLPLIDSYLGISLDNSMLLHPVNLSVLFFIGILISILSGYYPALLISAYKPVETIKNTFNSKQGGGILLRRGLVVFQFAVTFLLITCTIVMVSQIHYFRTKSLGFDKDAVVTFDIPQHEANDLLKIKNELLQNPYIYDVSFSLNTPSTTINKWWTDYEHTSSPHDNLVMEHKAIDENYLSFYDIELVAGRNIHANDSILDILINESMAKAIGFDNPSDAVGEVISYWNFKDVPVVGIVKDFHTVSLRKEIHPVMLWQGFEFMVQKASVKIDMSQAQQAIGSIEKSFSSAFPENYFTYAFLDEELNTFYLQEEKITRLLSLFSLIAIVIGCLGLYGLVSFMAAQKVKEVGIRKVLGASARHIVIMFTKEFSFLLGLAFVLATPIAYYFIQKGLENFTYKIPLSWWMFAMAGLFGLLIAGITISFQAFKAATANPVDSLRAE